MDYKKAYEELFQKVQDSDSSALKLKAMYDKETLEKEQEEHQNQQQQEEKKKEEQPSRAERLANERNERTPKTNLWG